MYSLGTMRSLRRVFSPLTGSGGGGRSGLRRSYVFLQRTCSSRRIWKNSCVSVTPNLLASRARRRSRFGMWRNGGLSSGREVGPNALWGHRRRQERYSERLKRTDYKSQLRFARLHWDWFATCGRACGLSAGGSAGAVTMESSQSARPSLQKGAAPRCLVCRKGGAFEAAVWLVGSQLRYTICFKT